VETSVYAPCEGHTPPAPEWKQRPMFREVLPSYDPASANHRASANDRASGGDGHA